MQARHGKEKSLSRDRMLQNQSAERFYSSPDVSNPNIRSAKPHSAAHNRNTKQMEPYHAVRQVNFETSKRRSGKSLRMSHFSKFDSHQQSTSSHVSVQKIHHDKSLDSNIIVVDSNLLEPPIARNFEQNQSQDSLGLGSNHDLRRLINTKIYDLKHKYQTQLNRNGSSGDLREDMDEGEDAEEEESQDLRKVSPHFKGQNQSTESQSPEVSGEKGQVYDPRNRRLMRLLDEKLPFRSEVLRDKTDKTLCEVIELVDNFERVFVAYINENYRTFTENDLQNLIRRELKQSLLFKIDDLIGAPGFSGIDPANIKFILKKAAELKSTNDEMRDGIHSLGVLINQLALSSVNLKK